MDRGHELFERHEADRRDGPPPFLAGRASVGQRKATANLREVGDRLAVGHFHAPFMPMARMLILVTTIEREEQE
jgi:hypothetical protein